MNRRAARAALLDAWQRRELSNFEYLMELNTLSGRTFNDLNQYPVFPWVLADYTSPSLNLADPASYRDLSKPVGALTDDRLAQVIERYEQMEAEADMPRFHYGSHYSSAGAVLFWLLRLEPYTSYSIELQSGRFDHADRLFASLEEAWHSCTTSLADVKELVPEFFYLPDFLRNDGGFELGVRQDHKRVGDVVLPMWARSADDFIAQHRRALESEHVSSHLHLWVDLIFGAKQQGQAAQEAHNVFFYLTYEGAVDLESVADPAEREALSTQIACFGQTPMQLFAAPHPPRRPPLPFLRPVHWGAPGVRPFARVPLGVLTAQSRRQHAGPEPQGGSLAIAALCLAGDLAEQRRLVVLDARSAVHSFRWPPPASRGPVVSTMRRQCSTQLPGADSRKSRYSALLPGGDGGRGAAVLSGGHWDGTLCVSSEAGRTLHAAVQHSRTITCLAVSGAPLVAGACLLVVVESCPCSVTNQARCSSPAPRTRRRSSGSSRRPPSQSTRPCRSRCARCAAMCARSPPSPSPRTSTSPPRAPWTGACCSTRATTARSSVRSRTPRGRPSATSTSPRCPTGCSSAPPRRARAGCASTRSAAPACTPSPSREASGRCC